MASTMIAAGRVHTNADRTRTCTLARTPDRNVHLCTDPDHTPEYDHVPGQEPLPGMDQNPPVPTSP